MCWQLGRLIVTTLIISLCITRNASGTVVQIRITKLDIEELDSFNMEMHIRLKMEQSWKVEGLQGLNETVDLRPADALFIENAREAVLTREQHQKDEISGRIVMVDQYAIRIGCLMHFATYPFDHQRCPLEINSKNGSVRYAWNNENGDDIVIPLDDDMQHYVIPGIIFVSPFSVVRTSAVLGKGEVSKFSVIVHTRRNYSAYLSSYFVPVSSFVFISLLTLWLVYPKISVMVNFLNIILVHIFLMLGRIHLDIPKVYYCTAANIFSATAVIFVAAVLFVNVYVLYYIKSEEEDDAEGARRRRAYELNIRNDIKFIPPSLATSVNRSTDDESDSTRHEPVSAWVLVKRKILDRIRRNSHWALLITYLLFNFVFWLTMLCIHYLQ